MYSYKERMFDGVLSAISFLTIIPIKKKEVLSVTLFWFPLVGLFLGGCLVLINFIFGKLFIREISIALLVIFYTVITGAIHLDGLADTIDGIFSGVSEKAKILEIMDDSRIGTQGVIAIIFLLLLKFLLLLNIPKNMLNQVLVFTPVIGRWFMVISLYISKPAKINGLGKLFIERVNFKNVLSTTIFSISLFLILFKLKFVFALFVIALLSFTFLKYISHRIGGMTGDTIGAVNELSEVFFILVINLMTKHGLQGSF